MLTNDPALNLRLGSDARWYACSLKIRECERSPVMNSTGSDAENSDIGAALVTDMAVVERG